ncbi:siphovirus Gp157 family protein [Lactobacillus salivarius]|uniref:Siphovirus Gp157 family protein n=1 Tax=Ligilactobacillus salivarius TaxID=1624 RepID=A0ABD6J9I5_9LACO|nr:siphovirus Gp157 family protein [Ligilactobacillus salivarius]MYY21873.1 siphovirus Gp157 family protein [Ligilactobacillus salivarius]MYY73818.1 siphovirus Gp157 family protein [Ligilactobacillus salivarius]
MNLFELNQTYRDLEEREDLDPEVLADTLDSINDAREIKLDNIATWIDKNKATVKWATEKIQGLQEAKKYMINQNSKLQEYMTQVLDDAGIKQLLTKNHILRTRNYKAKVVVDNLDKLPDEFKKISTETKADKVQIFKILSAGQEVPGAHLKPNRGTVIK